MATEERRKAGTPEGGNSGIPCFWKYNALHPDDTANRLIREWRNSGIPLFWNKGTGPGCDPWVGFLECLNSRFPPFGNSAEPGGPAERRDDHGRGRGLSATNGSTGRDRDTLLSLLTPRLPRRGTGGGIVRANRSVATFRMKQSRPVSPPHRGLGGNGAGTITVRERSDPRSGDGLAVGMPAGMPAGQSPVADLHQRAGGRRGRPRRGGSEADPVSTRPAEPGCQKCHSGKGSKTALDAPGKR